MSDDTRSSDLSEDNDVAFEYKVKPLNEIRLEMATPSNEDENRQVVHGGKFVKGVVIDDQLIQPSQRFWTSLYAKFGLNTSFFKYFAHDEVFQRISDRDNDTRVRVTIEKNTETGDQRLLAATGLRKPVVIYDDLLELLDDFQIEGGVRYDNGIITTTHEPRMGSGDVQIAGDQFQHRMEMHCPIDGYGSPDLYLALLRLVCSNGMVAMARSFKSSISLGTGDANVQYTLRRTLDQFSNDEGFAVLRDRFDTAANSWASLLEQQKLYKTLLGVQSSGMLTDHAFKDMMDDYRELCGDPEARYMGANTFTSEKKMRTLPVDAKVYELLNFATEVATHRVGESAARSLQGWVGSMLSNDYDLENSCDHFDQWRSFFMRDTVEVMNRGPIDMG